ncbi:hypothetical protein [Pseudonocardia sp. ICBG601]|uniref:hypothetical protein n=1 Tax=Pseudonocardia sp. ICBG601 TaxID=2846759 RepID=UPI001CF64B75|nr:hypothetical protein [Pseudonocardia sp. ICBG601]
MLVAEPRRVAARAAAARMSSLLGTEVGGPVGYRVRGDARTGPAPGARSSPPGCCCAASPGTRSWPGCPPSSSTRCTNATSTRTCCLTLLLDARDGLRPDLRLLATSATLDAARPAVLLGDDDRPAPVLEVAARSHDVAVTHVPPARAGRGGTERIENTVARPTCVRALEHAACWRSCRASRRSGGPRRRCAELGPDADVLALHGRLPAAEQDAALRDGPRRRGSCSPPPSPSPA